MDGPSVNHTTISVIFLMCNSIKMMLLLILLIINISIIGFFALVVARKNAYDYESKKSDQDDPEKKRKYTELIHNWTELGMICTISLFALLFLEHITFVTLCIVYGLVKYFYGSAMN